MLPFLMSCSSTASPIEEDSVLKPVLEKPTPVELSDLEKIAAQWKSHYKVEDPYSKITNDRGDGYEDLYGTRNLRVVLHGVYYRGGANNKYNKYQKRSNMNPLPTGGLKNLCEEGFGKSVYFYTNNYSSAPVLTNCGDSEGNNQLKYHQITAFNKTNHETLLNMIYERIKGRISGPIYGHCWNGWHASGLIASLALQQFCDWSSSEAGNYWKRNTDGNSKGYDSVLRQVTSFRKIAKFEITDPEKVAICPKK